MKKIFLLVLSMVVLNGCLPDDGDFVDISIEYLPIETYNIPEEFHSGETYEITVGYTKPNDCYQFRDMFFAVNGNERIVAVINTIDNALNCQFNPVQDEATFNFPVNGFFDYYVFKLWQGKDTNGNDVYTIVEIPVVE
jgi:hypothetical protein